MQRTLSARRAVAWLACAAMLAALPPAGSAQSGTAAPESGAANSHPVSAPAPPSAGPPEAAQKKPARATKSRLKPRKSRFRSRKASSRERLRQWQAQQARRKAAQAKKQASLALIAAQAKAQPPAHAAPTLAQRDGLPESAEKRPESGAGAQTQSAGVPPGAFGLTRPDASGSDRRTLDSPMAATGDGWKMLLYLAPILLLIVGALNLLRRSVERSGRLPGALRGMAFRSQGGGLFGSAARSRHAAPSPGFWSSLLGSHNLNRARQAGGSSIRVLESVPLGGSNLHLIEVRGRLLLLGATASGVNLLTELREERNGEAGEFQTLLQAAASDMDSLDMREAELPATALAASLEETLRDTNQALARRVRRLRTVQEEEEANA